MTFSVRVQVRRGDFELSAAFEADARSVGLTGSSGAGKTTLLLALAGFLSEARVRLSLDGAKLVDTDAGFRPPPHRRRIGYVFQDGRLFPHLTVEANVAFAQRYTKNSLSVGEALKLVDMDGFEHRGPDSLSGGEARRVAIARALVADPVLLLLDEPFTGLDDARREAMIPYLHKLRDRTGTPMIIVSHHARDITDLCQAVVRLETGRVVGASEPRDGDHVVQRA